MSSTILDTIIAAKRAEVEKGQREHSIRQWEELAVTLAGEKRSLKKQLLDDVSTGIIAEFKRRSPSKGWFKSPETGVEEVVVPYERHGASGLSILTDTTFFGGNLKDLQTARPITQIPLLRKDFMIDPWQIAEAAAHGADVILLIAACLTPAEVASMAAYARKLGLEVLLELHDESELGHVCEDTELIGINNRDLKTFQVDIDRSLRMSERIPLQKIRIAESGIGDAGTINRFREHGFSGFLMGEHFMKAQDPGAAFRDFICQLNAL